MKERAGLSGTRRHGFTIVEILVVMTIILVLAGLILATSSYVHNKGARSRAEAEIAALSAALENYKADNGVYPSDAKTNALDARTTTALNPTSATYLAASASLYMALSGDTDGDGTPNDAGKSYMAFKPNQLAGNGADTYVKDPFGYSYGFSTINQTDPAKGYNPTFDLWSTAGSTTSATGWVKNW